MTSSIVFATLFPRESATLEGFPISATARQLVSRLEDQQVFPEIDLDKVKRTQGMNITFVTSAQSDPECVELMKQLGFPFTPKEETEKK